MIDNFLKLLQTRRSIRRFKPDPVPADAIEKILEAGRWAMSGANAQPWEFVVVQSEETRKQINDAWLEPTMEAYEIEQTRIPEVQHHQLRAKPETPHFKDAPLFIVVLGDRRTFQGTVLAAQFLLTEGAPDAIYLKNMANATQNIHLAAAASGLGSEWISVNRLWGCSIKKILGIPEILEVHTLIAIGYAAYQPKPSYRRSLNEIVHYEKYDHSKYRTGRDIVDYVIKLRKHTEQPYVQGFPTNER
ncbi:MAG: nitroreductase family protein [Dehalococcoidales bacterium]|nr:nitroreductase family protein [Dehalococcoidales bacterium]